uniref:transglutaminase-like domain-containing protein n=1 Tax=Candidatus Electrothrix sp. TaxID=2170559 RepID=UPI004056C739
MKNKSIFNKMRSKDLVIAFATLLVLSIFSPICLMAADVAGQGWHLSDIEPITPGAPANLNIPQAVMSTSIPVAMSSVSVQVTPEITELARGLMYDPKLIYEFVRNNIDYVPYFGSLKGAALTLFDKSGNDFDQASLMVSLLRESGYTARFAYGKMTIPGDQMVNWLGVEPGWQGIGNVLPSGGFYNEDITLYADGTTKLPRVWVVVTIDGTDYSFDPAFKQYIKINKLADIDVISGYNRAELLSEVSTGATVGSDYTQNLNKDRLISKMEEYSAGIVSAIREQYPNSSVKELLGGRKITPEILEGLPVNLPFATENIVIWDDIPYDKTATMQIEHLGINHTFFTPQIAANRLSLSYTATDFKPEIRLDGVLIATGNATSSGSKNNCVITINHPYAADNGKYIDQTSTYFPENGSTYAIISNFGGSTETLIASRQKKLTSFLYQGMADTSEAVQGETLNIMGHGWMQQCRLADKMLSRLTDTISIRHHSVGFMAQEAGYYIDVKTAYSSIISIHQDDEIVATRDKIAHFNLASTISSAFEHGILEQKMGSDNPGIST